MFGLSIADLVDLGLSALGVAVVGYMIVVLRRGKTRSWMFLMAGMIQSSLAGFGWCLLSLFVFPFLAGAEMSFSPDVEPLPFIAELSIRQAIPSGIVIALGGIFLTWRSCSRSKANG